MIERGPKGFHAQLSALAKRLGWRRKHERRAGKRWAPQGEERGWFDFVFAREGRVIFVEAKGDRGSASEDQEAWAALFRSAGLEVYLWGPSDLDAAARVLSPGYGVECKVRTR